MQVTVTLEKSVSGAQWRQKLDHGGMKNEGEGKYQRL